MLECGTRVRRRTDAQPETYKKGIGYVIMSESIINGEEWVLVNWGTEESFTISRWPVVELEVVSDKEYFLMRLKDEECS